MPKLWQGDVAYYKVQTFKESHQEWHLTNDLLLFLVCSLRLCPTLCDLVDCSMPGFPVLHYLLEFAQIHVHWVGDAIQPSHPVALFSCLQSFPESETFPMSWLFPSGGQSIGASAFSISPSNDYSGLISFRIDWFDLLVVQGTLKTFLQHNLKASIL